MRKLKLVRKRFCQISRATTSVYRRFFEYIAVPVLLYSTVLPHFGEAQVRFTDDFAGDLSAWELTGGHSIEIIDSNDPQHHNVMVLNPDGIIYALIKNSDQWGAVRIEGEVLFPTSGHSYLGVIYNYTQTESRNDFGQIYIKGNGSYLRVNPWRDGNVSRLLYEEYKTPLEGTGAIVINEWQKFKAEIKGNTCHFYVGNMSVPKITFEHFEHESGLVGFKPRVAGAPTWIDNIRVTSIENLTYNGPGSPQTAYEPDSLITKWEVIGPLSSPIPAIEWESDPGESKVATDEAEYVWKPFQTDARGAVITGRITEYSGDQPVAYFRTTIESDTAKNVILHFSTIDEIGLWVNARFRGFVYRDGYLQRPNNDWYAWYDFWKNPEHAGQRVRVRLEAGTNQVVLRVRNGQYASGGFFLRVESE